MAFAPMIRTTSFHMSTVGILRGLRVFAAWVNHNDSKSLNSLDMLVEEEGNQIHQASI